MSVNKTAILIFANSAQKEATLKPFRSSKALYKLLNARTIAIAKETKLQFFHYSENQQIGDSFSTRFTNAITSIFNKGFENIIVIGNDTPHLTKKHILKAEKSLKQQHCVLGLSKDGGFYLMGLQKSHFNIESFLKLPWQTSYLTRAIFKVLKSNNAKVNVLECLQDIDTYQDLLPVLNSLKALPITLKNIFLKLLFFTKKIIQKPIEWFCLYTQTYNFNKGSPVIL